AGQMLALIEGTQGQQTGIAGDLAPGEIGADGLMTVGGEAQLWKNTLYHAMDAPKGNAGSSKPSVHQPFRASFLFWLGIS
ncbi:MAG: hypothetical protein WCD02_02990, partial [Terriglobales bacterium]